MGIQTTVGQLAQVGGGRVDQPSGTLVDERASRQSGSRGRDKLYALVETSGPLDGREAAAQEIVRTLRQAYFAQPGSVTAGLQHAIREANSLLLEENRNSLPGERRTAGVTCAVLRDQDLFVAQAGPAAAYLEQKGQVSRFPDVSPWLDGIPPEEMDCFPLGERRDLNVALFHAQMEAGDQILLADERLARAVTPEAWPEILAQDTLETVWDGLLTASGGSDLVALLVRLGPPAGAGRVPAAAPRPPAWHGIRDRLGDWKKV
ncbi:MAG TPA: hypothetical protein VLC52_05125, partial [Anaerolineae bacterium]|nr:hypothetical protein [Anaerolineae bacterium]